MWPEDLPFVSNCVAVSGLGLAAVVRLLASAVASSQKPVAGAWESSQSRSPRCCTRPRPTHRDGSVVRAAAGEAVAVCDLRIFHSPAVVASTGTAAAELGLAAAVAGGCCSAASMFAGLSFHWSAE